MLSAGQERLVEQICEWMCDVVASNYAATIWEDVIRGEIVHRGLQAGWSFVLNRNTPRFDVTLRDGVVSEVPTNSQVIPGSNPDIRISAPDVLRAELKVRGRYGPGATLPVYKMDADFSEVMSGKAHVFFLAIDVDAFRTMRGGRAATLWNSELPDISALTANQRCVVTSRNGTPTTTRARIVHTPFGDRVVAAFHLP